MDAFLQDLRFAVRGLRRSPYVVLVAILSIGISAGSAVAAYSWMDGLVLHPFPAAADQTRLVGIEVAAPGGMGAWSYPSFSELERSLHSLSGIAAFRILRASVRSPGEQGSTPLLVSTVSGHYFDVLACVRRSAVRSRTKTQQFGRRSRCLATISGPSAMTAAPTRSTNQYS
jgi:putative ABC transport system permease protein